MDPRIEVRLPTAEEYLALRDAVGWGRDLAVGDVEVSLDHSLFSVVASKAGEVVAAGRVIGDGGLYFYVQDVMVLPRVQGEGVGAAVMGEIMGYIDRAAPVGAFIGLMAAADKADFYRRYGFEVRPENSPGMYQVRRNAAEG